MSARLILALFVVSSLALPCAAAALRLSVATASLAFDQRSGQPLVTIRLTPDSTRDFGRFTQDNVGRKVSLRVDGKTVQETVIREPIIGGSGQILVPNSDEGRALAARLVAGAPLDIEVAD